MTAQGELAALEAWVAASLAWAQVDEPDAVHRALRWTWHVWSAGHDQVPPSLVHDLGCVLWRGPAVRFASARRPDDERARRLRAEDRLLAPWLLDPGVLRVHVILAGLPPELLDKAVAHAVALCVPRWLEGLALPEGNVGRIRGLVERWAGLPIDREELLRRAGPMFDVYAPIVDQLVDAVGGRPLLRDEDVWELAHLHNVRSEAARLALRTMHAITRRIGPASPSTLLALRRRAREVPLDDTSSDVYPTGGFDAMSTHGSLENVVRSEVSYVGEGVLDGGTLDLFDLRYLEGELLYYTRDESPLLEERRKLSLVVEIAELRHKVRELPTQTLVLCLACGLRLHADLVDALGPLAVTTSLLLVGDDVQVLEEESALLRISLAAEIAHRRAEVVIDDTIDLIADPRRVVFSVRPRPSGAAARAWIRVGGRRFVVDEQVLAGRKVLSTEVWEVDASDPAGLRGLVDRLLAGT